MTNPILAPEHRDVLTGFAHANVLVALDFDGTLSPIAPTPEAARLPEPTRDILTRLAVLYPCVVISGRALEDVSTRLQGIPLWYLFGNHGIEPAHPAAPHTAAVREWVRELKRLLPPDTGVSIEDKRHSITLHYRQAPDRHRAMEAIDAALALLPDARALGGADSVSLLPGGTDKGTALQQARTQFACDAAIFVGDDATDETAFCSDRPERLLGIRIGPSATTRARYHLRSQEEIDDLLQALVDFRHSERPARRRRARAGE